MIAVTPADARLQLPELIGLAAKGEQVVIVQNGVVLAGLTPPPFQIPTPEEEAARLETAAGAGQELNRLIAQWHAEDGLPYPPKEYAQLESPAASPCA